MKQRYQLLLIVVLFASIANAAITTTQYYVNTDTGDDGNDGLSATVDGGGVGPWATIFFAESELDIDHTVGDGDISILNLAGATPDTTAVNWGGATTSATQYISLVCDGIYSLVVNDVTAFTVSSVTTNHLRIDNINIEVSAVTAGGRSVFRVQSVAAGNDLRITNSILKGPDDNAREFSIIRSVDTDTILSLNNTLVYDAGQNATSMGIRVDVQGGTIYGYNCTIANCRFGVFLADHVTAIFTGKNTIVSDSVGPAYTENAGAGTITLDNSASDDADPGGIDGANNVWGATPNYQNLFEIVESTWVGKGADISGEAQWFVDTDTDYYGTVRGVRGGWDIGYYEYPASLIAIIQYYRRKTHED